MDSDSSFDSCNIEVFPVTGDHHVDRPDWEEFTNSNINTLPLEPIDYINDLKIKLERKDEEIFFRNLDCRMLEKDNESMKARIMQLETELQQKTKKIEEVRDVAFMAAYERVLKALEELKAEAVSRYDEYLKEKINNIVGDVAPLGRRRT